MTDWAVQRRRNRAVVAQALYRLRSAKRDHTWGEIEIAFWRIQELAGTRSREFFEAKDIVERLWRERAEAKRLKMLNEL